MPLQAAVLESGRYLVLWPADERVRLAVGGERFVVDPYAGGELYSLEEVGAPQRFASCPILLCFLFILSRVSFFPVQPTRGSRQPMSGGGAL